MGRAADDFAELLQHYKLGRALWDPEPPRAYENIYIGDVGYIDEDGAFFRLFNVTVDENHPLNSGGVPENFTPLRFNKRLLQVKPNHYGPTAFSSDAMYSNNIEAHAGAQGAGAGAKLAYSYQCKTHRGALLVIHDSADKRMILPAKDVVQYIRHHLPSWLACAKNTYGLECREKDLVMVRGTVKTSAWTVASFSLPAARSQELELNLQIGSGGEVGVRASSTAITQNSVEHRSGPSKSPRPPSLHSVSTGKSVVGGRAELPEVAVATELFGEEEALAMEARNQAVFLGYYQAKRRIPLFPRQIRANAGPHELPRGEDPAQSPGVGVEDHGADSGDDSVVETEQSTDSLRMAIEDVLDYILRFSDAEVAVTSDGELAELFPPDCPPPDNIQAWLLREMPSIDVDDEKTGMLSNLEAIRRAQAIVQKEQDVLAQADLEERHARLIEMSIAAEAQAELDRLEREQAQRAQPQEFQQGSSGLSAEDREAAAAQGAALQTGEPPAGGAAGAEAQDAAVPMEGIQEEAPPAAAAAPEANQQAGPAPSTSDPAAPPAPTPPPPPPADPAPVSGPADFVSDMPEERLSGTCVFADGKILIESPYGGTRITEFPHVVLSDKTAEGGSVTSVSVTKDNRFVSTGCEDCAVRIYDLQLGTLAYKLERHQDTVWAVAFSPDGSRLISGGADLKAYLWDTQNREFVAEMAGHTGDVWLLAWAPDNSVVATGSVDTTVRLWDGRTGAPLHTLQGHSAVVMCISFSPDGSRLASCSDSTGILWDVARGTEAARLQGHSSVIWTLEWAADGARLVSGAEDQSGRVWDAETGAELVTINEHTGPVWSAVFSPDGALVASGSYDASVIICDSFTGERRHMLERDPAAIVNVVAYSAAGDLLACGLADGRVRVWNPIEGKLVAELQGHDEKVKTVEFMADDERMVTSGDDGTVRIWNMVDAMRL
ncbi:WD40 repeat domain-containing protein [Phanerochaete sordida]|uniref:WD40 repeat domain-containing protein n=1 Tax=Phanerochaete sordida TaxID=48140 RepID=A0A9P3GJX0_9APHY|nr:WD40 repeat domain-containing protein [Phanerochaete sordida]